MKHYYPSALVRLHVRLGDFGQPNPDELILLEFPVVSLTVEVNHWNQADTIDVEVDYEDFPIDPRIIRAITIEAFIADMGGPDPHFWEKQSAQDLKKWFVFSGVIDEIETGLEAEGRRTRLRGRDYTAYFLDTQITSTPIAWVEGGKPRSLVEILEWIVAQRRESRPLPIVPADGIPDFFPADYKHFGTHAALGKRNKRRGESSWEAMQEIAMEAGLLVYVELDQIVLREPHTLFLRDGMDPDNYYRWVLGENVKSFTPKREMGRQHDINVRVISYIPESKKTLYATAPATANERDFIPAATLLLDSERGGKPLTEDEIRKLRTLPAAGTTDSENLNPNFRQYVFRGIDNQEQLQRIADEIYEMVRYHDMEVEFATDDFEDSDDHSVLELRFGAPLVFGVIEQFRSILAFDASEQIERLIAKRYPREAAEAIATALENLTVPFYVHSVKHHFETRDGGGYSLSVVARSRSEVGPTAAEVLSQIESG